MTEACAPFRRMLDRAGHEGRIVDLWWRDDDAVRDGPELSRLLRLSAESNSPVALATIPALIEPSLVARVAREPMVDVLVHGFEHANHAPAGGKPAEFGPDRAISVLAAEVLRGHALATHAFGQRVVDLFVPPWNRIAPELAAALPRLGFTGLSGFAGSGSPVPGLVRIDAHLDPVDWRGSRGLVAPERLLGSLGKALSSGRSEPIGFLTHHLVFDETLWAFCEEFVELAAHHPAVRFRPVRRLVRDALRSSPRPRGPAWSRDMSVDQEHAR